MILPAPFRALLRRWMPASIVWLLCCALLLGAVGFPTVRRVAKDRSVPFPCQDKACGCRDAASCWKSCCCNTNQQKLAWAKRQGVTPPAFVVAAAAKEQAKAKKPCCQMAAGKGSAGACGLAVPASPALKEAKSSSRETAELGLVLASSYRKCQGLATLWTLLGQALLPDVELPVATAPEPGEWLTIGSESLCGDALPPRLRPPRV